MTRCLSQPMKDAPHVHKENSRCTVNFIREILVARRKRLMARKQGRGERKRGGEYIKC